MNDLKKKLLIIDDDPIVNDIFKHIFESQFDIYFEFSGNGALTALRSFDFDFCIIDLKLSDYFGIDLFKKIKEERLQPNCIYMILTASDDLENEVKSHELGISEYIRKPIVPKLLRAIFKKYLNKEDEQNLFIKGDLKVNLDEMRAYLGPEPLDLTNSEYRILAQLIKNPGAIFSRDELYQVISQKPNSNVDRSIDMHVSSLRKKIKNEGNRIKTKRGKGYSFEL